MYVTDDFTAKFYFGEDAGQYTGSTIPVLYWTICGSLERTLRTYLIFARLSEINSG